MRRDDGMLKRKRSTPLPTWALFAGLLGSQLIVTVLMALFTTALSMAFFHVRLPQHLLEFLGVVLLGAATLCSLGVAITALIPDQDAAPAVVNIIAFPLLFLSGLFFPVGKGTLHDIAQWLPLAAPCSTPSSTRSPPRCGTARRYAGATPPVLHSSGPVAADIAVIVVWLAIGTLVSLRTFRWVKKGE